MMAAFGNLLTECRERHGMSAYRLAKETGIPHPSLSRLEAGERLPTKEVMDRMRKAFPDSDFGLLEQARVRDLLEREGVQPEALTNYGIYVSRSPSVEPPEISDQRVYLPTTVGISAGFSAGEDSMLDAYPTATARGADLALTIADFQLSDMWLLPMTTLFVRCQQTADNGQMVIAHVDETDYVCRVFRDNGKKQWLETRATPIEGRIWLHEHQVEIKGVVVAYWAKP